MVFYELEMLSIPTISIACNAYWENYLNIFDGEHNMLELCLCQQGRILFEYPNGEHSMLEPGMFAPILKGFVAKGSSYQNEKQYHICIAVNAEYNCVRWESDTVDLDSLKSRVINQNHILIPFHVDMGESIPALTSLMQKIIYLHTSITPGDRLIAIGEWFTLTSMLTAFVLKEMNAAPAKYSPASARYVKNAEMYIQSNYAAKIQVNDIAQHLQISVGHLHKIFKEVKGISVLDYINTFRIDMLTSLIKNRCQSFKDASFNVGFEDPAYASRVFKKVKGISFRQYANPQYKTQWLDK